jgi:hypothetical protein
MKEADFTPTDELLIQYLDGTLDAAGRTALEARLKTDADLQSKLEWLRTMEKEMHRMKWEEPSVRFTDQVMKSLAPGLQSRISLKSSLLLLLGTLVTIVVSAMLVSAGVFDETGTLDMNNLISKQDYVRLTLPAIPLSSKWIINILIIINLALAFVVLDRTILKPFFEKRSHTYNH